MRRHIAYTHTHNHKQHCRAPQWWADDAIIKGMIHLLIFKGLPSFQYVSHFSLSQLSASQPLAPSVISDVSLSFSVSQSVPSFLLPPPFVFGLAALSEIAFLHLGSFWFFFFWLFNKQQTHDINNVPGVCSLKREVGTDAFLRLSS